MTETATAHEIEIRRVYDAPRELVWRAWTEPEQLMQWWGPHGWSTPLETVTMEVRPGGTFRLTSVSDEGVEMPVAGVVAALEPDDEVGLLGEQVHDLPLPLVAPLGAHDHQTRHLAQS